MVAPGLDTFRVARFKVACEARGRLRLLDYTGSVRCFSHIGLRGDGARRPRWSAGRA